VRSTTKQLIPGRKSQEVKGWDGGESGLGGGRAIVVINVLRLRLRIDVPDIRIVIYIRFIWNLKLKNYRQESGQARPRWWQERGHYYIIRSGRAAG